ncbi:oxidoreductase [Teratosphaeria nubilosa]|uniref:Oxidoreductase n=1 Tax=Teratosphaeria nubilosa TaxID=161662 RepID=A0A6G1L6U2_9PEZI|nr:oxidoreductase [Teratosphaeria nubilosa]
MLRGVALVTGAGGALGRAVVLRFARYGVTSIAGLDINRLGLDETKEALQKQSTNVEFLASECDLTSEKAVKGAIGDVVSRFGAIHYCVNNAGIGQPLKPTGETESTDFDRVMGVNFKGMWLCQKYELQQMMAQEARDVSSSSSIAERGSIVNVSSTLGLIAGPHLGVYASSKHAILGLMRSDALDYARKGIRVNAVCPGFIDTPLLQEETRKALASTIDRTPQGRLAQSAEVADAVCFLSGSMATHITGVALPVDGGFTAT